MFKALSRLFGSKPKAAPRPTIPAPAAHAPPAAPVEEALTVPSAKAKWEQDAARSLSREASPEELCGITPEMTPEQLRERLAHLYQRHNRAASSLDPQLREEAEFMLETLAGLREKYFGGAASS